MTGVRPHVSSNLSKGPASRSAGVSANMHGAGSLSVSSGVRFSGDPRADEHLRP